MPGRIEEGVGARMDHRLLALVGDYEGRGSGTYGVDGRFEYLERLEITNDGRPFLRFAQSTTSLDGTLPMHGEVGFLRFRDDINVEYVLAQMTGVAEVLVGQWSDDDGITVTLESRSVVRASGAPEITATKRQYHLKEPQGLLVCRFAMALGAEGPLPHTISELRRIRDSEIR